MPEEETNKLELRTKVLTNIKNELSTQIATLEEKMSTKEKDHVTALQQREAEIKRLNDLIESMKRQEENTFHFLSKHDLVPQWVETCTGRSNAVLTNETDKLKAANKQALDQIKKEKKKLKEAEDKLEFCTRSLANAQKEVEKLSARMREMEITNKDQLSEIETMKAESHRINEANALLESRCYAAQEELSARSIEYERIHSDMITIQADLSQVRQESDHWEQEYHKSQKASAEIAKKNEAADKRKQKQLEKLRKQSHAHNKIWESTVKDMESVAQNAIGSNIPDPDLKRRLAQLTDMHSIANQIPSSFCKSSCMFATLCFEALLQYGKGFAGHIANSPPIAPFVMQRYFTLDIDQFEAAHELAYLTFVHHPSVSIKGLTWNQHRALLRRDGLDSSTIDKKLREKFAVTDDELKNFIVAQFGS